MRILLLDDDQDSRHTAAQFLQDLGHEVVQCADAEEALEKWAKEDFPLVLADIHMPGISGVEMTRRLKALADGWRSDVVLMTGDRQPELILEALRAGGGGFGGDRRAGRRASGVATGKSPFVESL